MMESTVERMRQIKELMKSTKSEVMSDKVPMIDVDDVRLDYFYTEMETLSVVLDLMEKKQHKECLILLRTVLEKFLYFWLMMDGRKYRHKTEFRVKRQASKTVEERDNIYQLWLKLKKEGSPDFADAVSIQKGKEPDVIVVVYESEGYYNEKDANRSGELIPSYLFILDEYEPKIKHLSKLQSIKEGKVFQNFPKLEKTQDMLYNYFFYINSIMDNLVLNKLVSRTQADRIMVHYNFLSAFAHPSKNGVKLWQSRQRVIVGINAYDEKIIKDLIILYVAKLMQLYIRTIVYRYRIDWKILSSEKYDKIIEELNTFSKDLWFFDNEPISYDVWWSDVRKQAAQHRGRKISSTEILYYDDPYERLRKVRAK